MLTFAGSGDLVREDVNIALDLDGFRCLYNCVLGRHLYESIRYRRSPIYARRESKRVPKYSSQIYYIQAPQSSTLIRPCHAQTLALQERQQRGYLFSFLASPRMQMMDIASQTWHAVALHGMISLT
ncbi:hypothetical protein BDBG_17801 [Blastomyces gilchristii SLH14081]|uniref:Uncharacterized protein n=1 Tax=Blastomyces gilchristii (strain SLH14081) TaxID=559298 RepID=A0A179V1T2_BLAGS|nr:uncharacterized protein BDBG_17801 [Blastomyces gilchristii SLH14081]OAT13419.1 hypothetical protein BDBG_17801 [Blastomyces gilchristii SLH14081]